MRPKVMIDPNAPLVEKQRMNEHDDDECNCEPAVDPDDPEDDWHYRRTCRYCGTVWYSLHCPHDGMQWPCPGCNQRNYPAWAIKKYGIQQ